MTDVGAWDEHEPITVALERWGLLDVFDAMITERRREEAVFLLQRVGADHATADRIVEGVIHFAEGFRADG